MSFLGSTVWQELNFSFFTVCLFVVAFFFFLAAGRFLIELKKTKKNKVSTTIFPTIQVLFVGRRVRNTVGRGNSKATAPSLLAVRLSWSCYLLCSLSSHSHTTKVTHVLWNRIKKKSKMNFTFAICSKKKKKTVWCVNTGIAESLCYASVLSGVC